MNRRLIRLVSIIAIGAMALLVALDYAGAFGFRGNDWERFDHRSVRMTRVISGDTFVAAGQTIHLLDVDAPDPPLHWSSEATTYLTARLKDRDVILKLDGTQTRDESGALLAYVYVTVGDCLNVDIVRDGQAYADRRGKGALLSSIEQVENEARKKHRAMWNGLHDDQQPAWRREWLRQRFATTQKSPSDANGK